MTQEATFDPILAKLVRRFADSQCCWISSVRPDSRAHSVPVWHVWHRGRAYVVTSPGSVKTANIQVNPGVVLAHPDPLNPVIVEGQARLIGDHQAVLQPLFVAKYDWDIASDSQYTAVVEVTPTKLIAWGEHGEGRWPGEVVEQVTLDR